MTDLTVTLDPPIARHRGRWLSGITRTAALHLHPLLAGGVVPVSAFPHPNSNSVKVQMSNLRRELRREDVSAEITWVPEHQGYQLRLW